MKISELKTGQGNVDVEGTIKEIGEVRNFNKFGRELKVANAVLGDDSGSIKLTLWNDDVDKFKEGDVVKITNGYVNEFQGESQLTSGKFGKVEKVGEGEASAGQNELPSEVPESDTGTSEGMNEAPAETETSSESFGQESPIKEEEI